MSQIIKAFMGVFLTLFMAVTAMGILAAYMEVMNAQDMQARIVDEIENSDFNTGVVRQCFLQSEEAGYQLKVTFLMKIPRWQPFRRSVRYHMEWMGLIWQKLKCSSISGCFSGN